jgi:hypothetical protein
MAGQAGVPLVVRESEGQGSIEYLAFDPALDPVADWTGAPDLTERLVAMAAPLAISRTWSPTAFRARCQRLFQSAALTDELSNFPSVPVPFLVLFAALTLGYLLILGPVNFVLLRRIRRLSLAWVTVPVLGLTYLLSIFAIASHIRASSAVLNTVGVLTLDGSPDARPATFYMGLATPMSGDYHVTYRSAGLPAPLPELDRSSFSFRNASMLHATPLRMRIQEDPQTAVTFMAMRRWTVRDLSFDTSIPVPGGVQSTLTIDSQGDLTGSIRNGTNLDLVDPIIVAGQNVAHLPTILAGRSVHARVRPGAPDFSQRPGSILVESYGGNDLLDTGGFGGFDDCCDPAYPQERTLIDRVRNAASMLAQAQPDVLPALGEVMLVGWTQRPLEAVSVDGSTPQRRDLTLVVAPLSVRFPIQGPFRLRTGTIGSHVVDILPRAPQSSCCSFGFGFGRGPQQQQVTLGAGGFMTFEFDLHGARRLRFGRLAVSVNNQDSGTSRGRVYDWSAHRWVAVDLSSGSTSLRHPNRFVSSRGQILVRLVGSSDDDLTLLNPDHDVQIAGAGDVA